MRTLKKSEIKRVRGGVCGPLNALSHLKKGSPGWDEVWAAAKKTCKKIIKKK